jgi:hypothetical protein
MNHFKREPSKLESGSPKSAVPLSHRILEVLTLQSLSRAKRLWEACNANLDSGEHGKMREALWQLADMAKKGPEKQAARKYLVSLAFQERHGSTAEEALKNEALSFLLGSIANERDAMPVAMHIRNFITTGLSPFDKLRMLDSFLTNWLSINPHSLPTDVLRNHIYICTNLRTIIKKEKKKYEKTEFPITGNKAFGEMIGISVNGGFFAKRLREFGAVLEARENEAKQQAA